VVSDRLRVAAAGLVVAALLGGAAQSAGAGSDEQVTLQIGAQVGTKLWNVVSPVLQSLPANQHVSVGGVRYSVRWSNFQFGGTKVPTSDAAMAAARHAQGQSAFIDRPLSAAESKTFAAVPVWRDADVLLARTESSLCTDGVSPAAVRNVLKGSVRTWTALGATVAPGASDAIQLTVASKLDEPQVALPAFGLLRFPSARLVPGASALAALNDPSALVLMPWSSARPAIGRFACAIPIGGTAATEATIRKGTYPGAYTVYWAYRRVPRNEFSGKADPILRARDVLFRRHLATTARRYIIHPSAEFGIRLLP
jgi:hypothetical protein